MDHPKRVLEAWGIRPKKSLGQNFVAEESVLARILDTAKIVPDDTVLEIGPGIGALTSRLAEVAARVVAIELDDRLMPLLRERFGASPNVTLIAGDALDFDPAGLLDKHYKLVANLPYYLTGSILRHYLSSDHKPTEMTVMVQQEVAERLTARPGSMSLLSVSVQFYGEVSLVARVRAGSFWPRPDVNSAVVKIRNHQVALLSACEVKGFFVLVRAGFSQKRKQLHNNLRLMSYPKEQIELGLENSRIDGTRRAETLSVEEWIRLYLALSGNVAPATP